MRTLKPHPWNPYTVPENTIGVTTILKHIAVKIGKLTVEDRGDEMPLRMIVGQGLEAMCVQLYPDCRWQPEAMQLDGVSGHLDGLSLVTFPLKQDGRGDITCWSEFLVD